MIKILYAAGNNSNALIQLSRFIKAMKGQPYIIKIAAFKKSSPKNLSIDWTLDSLLDIFYPTLINLNNDNYRIYFDQIKYFNPDLVISDMEFFTSYAANILNIDLWQVSSSIINYAFTHKQKHNMPIYKQYSYIFKRFYFENVCMTNILDNSKYKFIYSHFGDLEIPPEIIKGYEWIRPYHMAGKESELCKHNIVAGLLYSNKSIINEIKKYENAVAFTNFVYESYDNVILKDIWNESEYYCNLKNSKIFVCEGQTSFLADAFYNGKIPFIITNFKDTECIINSWVSNRLKISTRILGDTNLNEIVPFKNNKIKYLHEKIYEHYDLAQENRRHKAGG